MKLSTRGRYGVRMVLDIALHGEEGPVAVKDIAKRQNLSIKYLEKLIRELKPTGLLISKRGPKGGHTLTKPLDQITVGEIVHALEGRITLVDCWLKDKQCPRMDECMASSIWSRVNRALHQELHSITIADLVEDQRYCHNPD